MPYRLTDPSTKLERTTNLVPASSDYTCIVVIKPLSLATLPAYRTAFVIRNAGYTEYVGIFSDTTITNRFALELDPDGASHQATSVFFVNTNRTFALAYVRKGNRHFFHRSTETNEVTLVGFLDADLSTITFADIAIGNDDVSGLTNLDVSYFKEWSHALTTNELLVEMNGSLHSQDTDLETDTPLLSNLVDNSGNGNDWTEVGTPGSFVNNTPVVSIVDITGETFPFTRVVTVAEFNANNVINFKYTASISALLGVSVGSFAEIGDIEIQFYLSDGTFITQETFEDIAAFSVFGEGDYYIHIHTGGSSISEDFTVVFEQLDFASSVPGCTSVISDDQPGMGAILFDAQTGQYTGFVTSIPSGELAAALPDGTSLWHDRFLNFHEEYLVLLDPDFNFVASFDTTPSLGGGTSGAGAIVACFASNATDFFVLNRADNKVWKITSSGVITDTGATVVPHSGTGVRSIGVDPLGQILYWTEGVSSPYIIYSWDLVSDVELPNIYDTLLTAGKLGITLVNNNNGEILVLDNGNILVAGKNNADSFSTLYYVTPGGSLIDFFQFSGTYYIINHIGYAGGNIVYIWLYDDNVQLGRYVSLDVDTGDVTTILDTSMFSGGISEIEGVIQSIGPSISCPMVINKFEECNFGPVEVGSIIVTKVVVGGDAVTEFPFVAGGGLSPTSFNLQDGEIQLFSDLPVGSGYSVEETVPAGWTVSYEVSNGTYDNITVANGMVTFVTVTNTPPTPPAPEGSGIYKIQPGKRNDTLWVTVSPESTTDVKIPNPKIRTALIGE